MTDHAIIDRGGELQIPCWKEFKRRFEFASEAHVGRSLGSWCTHHDGGKVVVSTAWPVLWAAVVGSLQRVARGGASG